MSLTSTIISSDGVIITLNVILGVVVVSSLIMLLVQSLSTLPQAKEKLLQVKGQKPNAQSLSTLLDTKTKFPPNDRNSSKAQSPTLHILARKSSICSYIWTITKLHDTLPEHVQLSLQSPDNQSTGCDSQHHTRWASRRQTHWAHELLMPCARRVDTRSDARGRRAWERVRVDPISVSSVA